MIKSNNNLHDVADPKMHFLSGFELPIIIVDIENISVDNCAHQVILKLEQLGLIVGWNPNLIRIVIVGAGYVGLILARWFSKMQRTRRWETTSKTCEVMLQVLSLGGRLSKF